MSVNRNDEVSLSDRYVLLLQEPIKQSGALRAQVAAREEETDSNVERLFSTVEELCDKSLPQIRSLHTGEGNEEVLHLLQCHLSAE